MISVSAIAAATDHALAMYPQEACGLVVADTYLACENSAPDPTQNFVIDSAISDLYIMDNTLQAVMHSHPRERLDGVKSTPSARDIAGQMATGVHWGIIDTDGVNAAAPYWLSERNIDDPLVGLPFHHGVHDCYSAVRRWFWQQRGIRLIEMPRDDMWWLSQPSMYLDNFERAGFCRVEKQQIQDGDVVLSRVNSAVVNHAGVYLDNKIDGRGVLFHHLPGRLSRRETAAPWLSRAHTIVRYNAN